MEATILYNQVEIKGPWVLTKKWQHWKTSIKIYAKFYKQRWRLEQGVKKSKFDISGFLLPNN